VPRPMDFHRPWSKGFYADVTTLSGKTTPERGILGIR
jgi:hypothetical protein